jgi:hypothetical protein
MLLALALPTLQGFLTPHTRLQAATVTELPNLYKIMYDYPR